MVQGIELFKQRFASHTESYILIGGTACSLAMQTRGIEFRSTRDLDVVLIVESLTPEFTSTLWELITEAYYKHINQGTGESQFYRFTHPKSEDYPFMIELFSREPDALSLPDDATLTPIPLDEPISSLSAILLDPVAYTFLKQGKVITGGLSTLEPSHIIPLKVQAFLDLSQRKENGARVDSKDIKKHKNDIFRLLALLTGDERITLPPIMLDGMTHFLDRMNDETIDRNILKKSGLSQDDALQTLSTIYQLTS
jgi:hypothetical protein